MRSPCLLIISRIVSCPMYPRGMEGGYLVDKQTPVKTLSSPNFVTCEGGDVPHTGINITGIQKYSTYAVFTYVRISVTSGDKIPSSTEISKRGTEWNSSLVDIIDGGFLQIIHAIYGRLVPDDGTPENCEYGRGHRNNIHCPAAST